VFERVVTVKVNETSSTTSITKTIQLPICIGSKVIVCDCLVNEKVNTPLLIGWRALKKLEASFIKMDVLEVGDFKYRLDSNTPVYDCIHGALSNNIIVGAWKTAGKAQNLFKFLDNYIMNVDSNKITSYYDFGEFISNNNNLFKEKISDMNLYNNYICNIDCNNNNIDRARRRVILEGSLSTKSETPVYRPDLFSK
jgi:hypothetical protein